MNHWTGLELVLENPSRFAFSSHECFNTITIWWIRPLCLDAKKSVTAMKIRAKRRFSEVGISSFLR